LIFTGCLNVMPCGSKRYATSVPGMIVAVISVFLLTAPCGNVILKPSSGSLISAPALPITSDALAESLTRTAHLRAYSVSKRSAVTERKSASATLGAAGESALLQADATIATKAKNRIERKLRGDIRGFSDGESVE